MFDSNTTSIYILFLLQMIQLLATEYTTGPIDSLSVQKHHEHTPIWWCWW